MLQLVSRHVIKNPGDWFQKVWYGTPESQLARLLLKLSMPFQVQGLWLHFKETYFLDLGRDLTVYNREKSTEKRL